MKKLLIVALVILAILIIAAVAITARFVSFYNTAQQLKIEVENSWAEVDNQYKRRFDLIPNLVETVKGYASHEQETFEAVTQARASVGGMVNISPEIINDPQMFEKYQQAQSTLGGALQRLLVVQEQYPELKANENFLRLQDELSGTENRITVARKRFNDAVTVLNRTLVTFPNNIFAGLANIQKAQFFKAPEEAQEAPKVQF